MKLPFLVLALGPVTLVANVGCAEPRPPGRQMDAAKGSTSLPARPIAGADAAKATGSASLAARPIAGNAVVKAIQSGSVAPLRKELAAGADPNAVHKDPLGSPEQPLLVLAADSTADQNRLQCVELLLERGAAVDSPVTGGPWDGFTALVTAAARGNLPVVQLLLRKGANPNHVVPANGHTPLMSAAVYPDVANAMLQAGALPGTRDLFGRAAITFAALGGCVQAFDFLRSRGGDPDLKDSRGKSAADYLRERPKNAVATGVCAP